MVAFRFAHGEYLYGLIIIPVLVLIFILAMRHRKKALEKFGEADVIHSLIPDISNSRPVAKFIFAMLALFFLIVGIACPQFGSKLEEVKREGVEVIIALDVSNSMMAEDIKPNRLERAKRAISKMIDEMRNDKIGLIVFAGDAYTQLPITTDYAAAKMFLSTITTGSVPIQGTAIGSAIELAMGSFSEENDKNKAMIIITDGENHEDNAEELAAEAAKKDIIVYTIGMGLPKGGPIPIQLGYGNKDFRRDKNGQVVITKLNEMMLQKIAAAGKGIYIRANNTRTGLNALFEEIDNMEKQEYDSTIFRDYENRYQLLFMLALLFIVFEFVLLARKSRLLSGINLFKTNEKSDT